MPTSVVLFGDSILGQMRKPVIALLEDEITGGATVYNCAAGGWDSNDGVRRAAAIARIAPDVVVLCFGGNDCAPAKRVQLDRFSANLDAIVEAFAPARAVGFPVPAVREELPTVSGRTNAEVLRYREALRAALPGGEMVDPDLVLRRAGVSPEEAHKPDGLHLTDAAYEPLVRDLARIISAR